MFSCFITHGSVPPPLDQVAGTGTLRQLEVGDDGILLSNCQLCAGGPLCRRLTQSVGFPLTMGQANK
jgi:hypothetical protein